MIRNDDPDLIRDRYDLFRSDFSQLFYKIRKGIWHITSLENFIRIQENGFIRPNNGRRPFTFPQSKNSYGLLNDCICLFDLASATENECILCFAKWTKFFYHYFPFTVAFELDRSMISGKLIPNNVAREKIGNSQVWIPWVEA